VKADFSVDEVGSIEFAVIRCKGAVIEASDLPPETGAASDAPANPDAGAMAAFAAHVGKHPADQLASFHLKRLLNGATGTRIALD
jgi:hypothetical protein